MCRLAKAEARATGDLTWTALETGARKSEPCLEFSSWEKLLVAEAEGRRSLGEPVEAVAADMATAYGSWAVVGGRDD